MSRTVVGMLVAGVIQIAAYFVALQSGRPEGGMAAGTIDCNCYAQAASRILEGHPFSYSEGEAPSTGTTSVAYPFVLAVPMACGATGTRIYAASFALAAVFYLVFLAAWGLTIDALFPPGTGRFAAAALVSLSGCCAYVMFLQSDQSLWMAASAVLAWASVRRRRIVFAALLVLAPWIRPEGLMLVVSVAFFALLFRRRDELAVAALATVSGLGVFALNHALTGEFQFSSISGKGYLVLTTPFLAAQEIVKDVLAILSSYLCGLAVPVGRFFSVPSPFSAVFFWVGLGAILSDGLRRALASRLTPFVGAMALGVLSTSSSGYAGFDFDRYLGWMLPPVLLSSAYGLQWFVNRLPDIVWRKLPIVVVIAGSLFSTISMAAMMKYTVVMRDRVFTRVRTTGRSLPPGEPVGSGELVFAYELPGHPYREITGIYSPRYRGCSSQATALERLKYRPDLRFPYWVNPAGNDESLFATPFFRRHVWGAPVNDDPLCPILAADWSGYDEAVVPPSVEGFRLVSRLDVSYAPDEKAAERKLLNPGVHNFVNFVTVGSGERGPMMVDCGRFVTDGESFALSAIPDRDAVLVLRTTGYVEQGSSDALVRKIYDSPVEVRVDVDGRTVAHAAIEVAPYVFTDQRIPVPAEFIRSVRPRFTVRGKFASFGYWLFQRDGGAIPFCTGDANVVKSIKNPSEDKEDEEWQK